MPDKWSQYLIQEPSLQKPDDKWEKYEVGLDGPGSSWENPLQEQGISDFERKAVQVFAGSPERAVEWLQREPGKRGKPLSSQEQPFTFGYDTGKPDVLQYEAKIYKPPDWKHTNYIAVRKKGTNDPWKVVAPENLTDISDLPKKIGENVPEIAISLSAPFKGASLATSALGTGAKFGGQVGLLEAGRRGLGKYIYGFEDTPEEIAKSAIQQGVLGGAIGAAAPVLGAGIKKVIPKGIETAGKALQVPSKVIQKISGRDKDIALREAQKAALEQKILREEAGPELLESQLGKGASIAEEMVSKAPKELPKIAKEKPPGTFIDIEDIGRTKIYGTGKARVEVAAEAIDPIYGLKAKVLDEFPWIKDNLRKHFGDQMASEAGSESMAWRKIYLPRWAGKRDQEIVDRVKNEFQADMAKGMLADPKFNKLISGESKLSISKVARGSATTLDRKIFQDSLKSSFKKANLAVLKARLNKMNAGWVSGRGRGLETGLGALLGYGTFGPMGGAAGALMGHLRVGRGMVELGNLAGKGLENLGRWLGNPAELAIAARGAPPGVRSLLETPLRVLKARGINAYRVALSTALQNPVVREWMTGQEQNLQNKP